MVVFAYEALDRRQRPVAGSIAAETPALARQSLRAEGLSIVALVPHAARRLSVWSMIRRRRRVSGEHCSDMWRSLSVLLQAGVPLVDALEVCRSQQRGAFEARVRQLREDVRNGLTFCDAVAREPAMGDALAQVILRVGEQSGSLASALAELASYQGRRAALSTRFVTALTYPAIVACVGLGVVLFLMTYIVPQLVEVLASANRELPGPTRCLKAASDLLVNQWVLIVGCIAVIGTLLSALGRTQRGRRWREAAELRIPIWGGLVRRSWVARISAMLATMLRVDVRFTEALRIVRNSLPHKLYAVELEKLEAALERGAPLADPLRDSRLIPPLVVRLLQIGQESGELPSMLDQVRAHFEQEVELALGRCVAVLEPVLLVFLAAVIGFVVVASFLPILETTTIVQ